mgnify:CR=1 FL=1
MRVHPASVLANSWLANVNGVYNAISIRGDVVGRNMLIGRGAGAFPTGSAVVGDIVDVARNILKDSSGRVPPQSYQAHSLQEVLSRRWMMSSVSIICAFKWWTSRGS